MSTQEAAAGELTKWCNYTASRNRSVWLSMGFILHLPLVASLGGATFLTAYGIAWQGGTNPARLILAGVIVSAIVGSLQSGLIFLESDLSVIHNAAAWTVGSIAGVDWSHVRLAAPWTLMDRW